jgi:ketosteroid isomerase-like protein
MFKLTRFVLMPLAILMLCISTRLTAQNVPVSPDTNAIRKQIEANDQAIFRAIHSRDFAALEKFFSPQMVVNNPANEIFTRDDVFAAMKRGGLNYLSLKGTVESFKVFGDTAVEMGHEDFIMAVGPAAGKPLQRRYTEVWQRTGDRWVQIARQATILNVDAAWVYSFDSQSKQH